MGRACEYSGITTPLLRFHNIRWNISTKEAIGSSFEEVNCQWGKGHRFGT
jgi:hypothetical protein